MLLVLGVVALVFAPAALDHPGGDDAGSLAAAVFAPTVEAGITASVAKATDAGAMRALFIVLAAAAVALAGQRRGGHRFSGHLVPALGWDSSLRPPRRGPPVLSR